MEHEAFLEAGKNPGIEIWTIDQFEPVPVDSQKYGKFYNADSYIVLKTTGTSNSSLSYDVHFWLGSKTTQDKSGSAAIWTVTLDDMLGGKAVHHREIQGHESSLFLGYFKPAIRYMEGGTESGFNEVETNAGAEKRLLRLSGCDNMRIEEVPAEASSLTKEHCFILEVEHDIFVLMPEGAKATQRRKIISVANKLRDEEHNGRATIEIIDDFSSSEDINMFFEALGSGSMDDLGDADSLEGYDRENSTEVFLYKVLVGDELDLVDLKKPYKQSHLSSEEIYILDTPCTGVYIWFGKDVDPEVKKTYYDMSQKSLDMKGYPTWIPVTKVSEGSESYIFKQYFHNWDTTVSYAASKGISETDSGESDETTAAKSIGKSAAVRGYMPDDGEGPLSIVRISEEQEDITENIQSGSTVLYQSEVYVIKYQYTNGQGDEAFVVYLWIGAQASEDDQKIGSDLLSQYEEELDNVILVRVPQGKETKHFLSIFKGKLAIVMGSKDNDYAADNSKNSYVDDHIRLFRIEGTELERDTRAVQVTETGYSLEYDDVFVLETADVVYIWKGSDSSELEQQSAHSFISLIIGDEKDVQEVDQGDEPEELWDALGGKPEELEAQWESIASRRLNTPPELSAVTVTVTGKIKFEDLSTEYTQADLSEDGVYILDTGEEVFLWQGKDVPERVKMARTEIIKEYIKNDGMERTVASMLLMSLKQGNEPPIFRKLFPSWDEDMWNNQTSYEDMKTEAKAQNEH